MVFAKDTQRDGQPRGKQSDKYNHYGCLYTRVTGIWQTVWLERRPQAYIESVKATPDFDNSALVVEPVLKNIKFGDTFKITISGNGQIFTKEVKAQTGVATVVDMPDFIPWTPENPFLYNILYELKREKITDSVKSYVGMRKISIEGNKFYLNNEEIYLRFVLDQGYYSEGIWTAPSDDDLIKDIELGLKAGFNGARLHQKVFEERYLYHADRLGYLVWAEHGDWGYKYDNWKAMAAIREAFLEEMVRDYNHPSIIAWTPTNESVFSLINGDRTEHDIFMQSMYNMVKTYDPTRPCQDTSGFLHYVTDICTVHDYEQDWEKLKSHYEKIELDKNFEIHLECHDNIKYTCPYEGQPMVVDEYGGPLWAPGVDEDRWGYSESKDIEDVYSKIEMLTKVLVENENIAGYCYTQLTDVEQEQNGIYTYDRKEKFDMKRIKAYFQVERK